MGGTGVTGSPDGRQRARSDARIVVLVSGAGSNLAALLERDDLGGRVVLVASDNPDAGALRLAADAGIPTGAARLSDHPDRAAWERVVADLVAAAEPDLVVLAGFMKILSPAFVERWPVVNVHPSLLPAFPGAHAVQAALDYGVKLTGCTVHFVDEQVDHGPIILQEAVAVRPDDDRQRLHARIKAVEHRLLGDAVAAFCAGRLEIDGRHVRRLA